MDLILTDGNALRYLFDDVALLVVTQSLPAGVQVPGLGEYAKENKLSKRRVLTRSIVASKS